MKDFFESNIDRNGRIARAVTGVPCLIVGIIISSQVEWWIGLILICAGLFAVFEASGALRACGIKTKL